MARGESPYKGHYTVPTIDFSPLERGGAAWGEAFKGIGESVGAGIEKYQLNKQKSATLASEIEGKLDAMRLENPEMLAFITQDPEGGKYLKDSTEGDLTLKGQQAFSGYLTSLTGGSDAQVRLQRDKAQKDIAEMTATGQEWLQSYNIAGVEQVDAVTNRIEAGLQKRRESRINELVDKNKLSPADATKQWRDTMAGKERQQLLSDLSRPDKITMAQADLYIAGTAVPLRGDQATKLISDLGNLDRQYEVEIARRKAMSVAETVKAKMEEDKRKVEAEKLKIEKQRQDLELGAQALLGGEYDLQEKQEVLNALPEKQRQEQVKRENTNILDDLAIKEKRAEAKALEEALVKFPQGQIIARKVGNTMVYLMNTGQTIQVIDTGAQSESQRLKLLQDTMGPKLLKYWNQTRDDDTGLIDDPEDMNDGMEKALYEVFGFEPIFDEGKTMPKDITYWKFDKKTKKYKPADAPAASGIPSTGNPLKLVKP